MKLRKSLLASLHIVWRVSPIYTLGILLITIFQGFAPIIGLHLTKLMLDRVASLFAGASQEVIQALLYLIIIQALFGLVSSIFNLLRMNIETLFSSRVENKIILDILRKAHSLPINHFEDSEFYDRLENAYAEAGTRPLEMMSGALDLLQSGITLVSFVGIVWTLNPWALTAVIIAMLPSFWVQTRFGNLNYWMMKWRAPEARKQAYLGNILHDDVLVKEMRLFNLVGHFLTMHQQLYGQFFQQTSNLLKKQGWYQVLAGILSGGGTLIAMIFLLRITLNGEVSVGEFTFYAGAIAQLGGYLAGTVSSLSNLYSNSLFMTNLFDFLAIAEPPKGGLMEWEELLEVVTFDNVSFKYPNAEKPCLNNVSFSIERGKTLAVVGPNGAGKTTLIKLLVGLYQPTEGRILFNGQDISLYTPDSIFQQISAVFQDFGRYQFTAKDNVALGRVERSAEDGFNDATRRARADTVIAGLPKGADTQLGKLFEQGVELSGGQWQKIALSRSYFRKAGLLILDEPTAALDAESEIEVFKNVRDNMLNCITVLISHRFSSVRSADAIVVLDKGSIVAEGTHHSLMQASEYYRTNFNMQAQGYLAA